MRRVFHPIDFTKTDSQTIMAKNILIYTEIQKKTNFNASKLATS